jgi:hypothetical protein
MELLGVVGHLESRFLMFRDSVIVGARSVNGFCQTISSEIVCAKRTISSEIVLDAPDGTTRL